MFGFSYDLFREWKADVWAKAQAKAKKDLAQEMRSLEHDRRVFEAEREAYWRGYRDGKMRGRA